MDQMNDMLSNPNFAQMMNEALQNPQLVDMMIQQNPQLRAMGPQARQILQSDQFRQMITNPQALQQMAQMQRSMGMNPFGGAGGEAAFPAPGVTNTTPAENREAGATQPALGSTNPPPQNIPSLPTGFPTPGSQNAPPNPFSMLFNPGMVGQAGANAAGNNGSPLPNPMMGQNNPFLQDPASLQALMQAMGGGNGGNGGDTNANPMANLMNMFGGAAPAPADSRPPEERFATQLRQLNEMGFFDFDRNIQALTRSGGDVNGALEWLFSQPS